MFFFCKQKTAYEMRISDWSSDVCSSDLSADAWLGGFGDRERTLLIMKDPRSGPIAVITLGLVLLLKFAALLALIEQRQTLALIIVPMLERGALMGVFMTTPYVRAGGFGKALADHLPRKAGWQVLLACSVG